MNQLPFLKENSWPRIAKPAEESKYGFSEFDDLKEQALSELVQAINSKDHKQMMEALSALIDCVMSKEGEGADASLRKEA
jgi:hypothetical protein